MSRPRHWTTPGCVQMHAMLEKLSREKIVLLITHDARMLRETDDVLELGR